MAELGLRGTLRRGAFRLELDLELPGGVVAIIGPNGSGKSSLLRLFAGSGDFAGRAHHRDRVLCDSTLGIHCPPEDRRVGYLPQAARLFPHLSVLDNVGFGVSGGRSARRSRARDQLQSLSLDHLAERSTRGLSGGEAQLVALARALATDPRLLLLDEPTASLDVENKAAMRRHLAGAMAGRDCLVVTHDLRDLLAWEPELVLVDGGQARRLGDLHRAREAADSAFLRELLQC
ncbi:MAG: ATP-binding cassette domain-containing protein [Myxococcota bacterium]|nr:ATP-binding cassette domain-containing protein [Myxococcota bacterium]